jgi:ABC-type branched-subunit amino acid transport system ATPase component
VPLHERRTFEIARLGLGFAPEESGIFPDLTVAENIEISTWTRPGGRPATERLAAAYEIFPVLKKYAARKGPEMSGGERKMLSIARALALDPDMLLLDEPFEGLSPVVTEELFEAFDRLRHEIAMIIVDHHLDLALALSDRTVVLERGAVSWAGASQMLKDDLALRRKMLWM